MTKDEKFIDYEKPSNDRPYYLVIDGKTIYVSEEHYRLYKQPLWAEHKRKEREKKCRVSNGRGGVKRCTYDCSACPFAKSGNISMDKMYDDYQYEFADTSQSIIDNLVKEELYQKMWIAINELGELDQEIVTLFMNGFSERSIAEKVNLSQKAVNKRKNKVFDDLRIKLKDYR